MRATNNASGLPRLRLVRLEGYPIWEQLALEEALLRAHGDCWCIFNSGSLPAIVLGISGKVEQCVNRDHWERQPIPLIRRFSGGGTVVVDSQTLFVTLIINRADVPAVSCTPEAILRWTAPFYISLFPEGKFQINGNDYALGDRKFGGNAQYLCRERWLHHSSLLWDFEDGAMDYLLQPKRQPHYRANRSHRDFLCRLRDYLPCKERVFQELEQRLMSHFKCEECSLAEASTLLTAPHRRTVEHMFIQ